jgi:hypothetical protein
LNSSSHEPPWFERTKPLSGAVRPQLKEAIVKPSEILSRVCALLTIEYRSE